MSCLSAHRLCLGAYDDHGIELCLLDPVAQGFELAVVDGWMKLIAQLKPPGFELGQEFDRSGYGQKKWAQCRPMALARAVNPQVGLRLDGASRFARLPQPFGYESPAQLGVQSHLEAYESFYVRF